MKWFISDIHIDHAKVLVGPRGDAFPTIEDWQGHMIEAINACVKKGDHLFLLGDFAFKRQAYWRQKLRGQVWLIKGNHDPGDEECIRNFGRSQFRHTYMTKVVDTPCWLSHYAHAFWPSSHHGAMHLYGHTHGQREDTLDGWMPQRRSMEVCPEVIHKVTGEWRPINEEEIHSLLSLREGHDPVRYYKDKRGEYVATEEP